MLKHFALATPLALIACTSVPPVDTRVGTAELRNTAGQAVGTATLVDTGEGLALDVAVSNLPAGPRGFHLHAVGRCTPPDFQSAGPHLNPTGHQHGLANPAGAHLGDFPNITVAAAGETRERFALAGARDEALAAIFDADGTAVMIHAQADDQVTDPAGNAGARIVCGELRRAG